MKKKPLIVLISVVLFFLSFSIVLATANIKTTASVSLDTNVKLDNPLGIDDPRIIIGYVIKAVLGIVGSLALLMFIYGGFTWVTSGGNDEKVKKGKDMILWASLGLGVIFLSYALVMFVINAVTGGGGTTAGSIQNPAGEH